MNKMLMLMLCALAALLLTTGCRVVEVENHGEEIARDQDGKPVLLQDGSIQTVKRGWKVYHNQHWMTTAADSLTANVKPSEISFALNGLASKPDGESLVSLVKTGLEGSAELASKIGVAIATGGGSVAAEGGASAIVALAQKAYQSFTASGGDAAKATVSTAADGTVSISDGKTCTTCKDGTCTTGACSE